jgi:uncharacterized membrane protein YhdT
MLERETVKKRNLGRTEHLKNSILFLLAWIVVLVILISEFKESDGINHLFSTFSKGEYLPILLIVSSIILLALFLRSIMLYLRHNANNDNKNT